MASAAATPAQGRGAATSGWPGTLWPGVAGGAPAAPSATDCRRPPAAFEVAGYESTAPMPGRTHLLPMPARATAAAADAPAARSDTATAEDRARAVAGAAARARADAAGVARAAAEAARERHAAAPPPPPPAPTAAPLAAPGLPGVAPAPWKPQQPIAAGATAAAARPADEPVSAGMVDDNADFGEYLAYRQRWPQIPRRDLDVAARVLLDVRDDAGRAVPDAQVRVRAGGRELPLWARTDASGTAWLMPQGDSALAAAQRYEVEVSRGGASTRVLWQPGQKDRLQARIAAAASERARLDLVFLVDATGSMGDEIDKLKRSMREVAEQIARMPAKPDLCFGLVAYRDRGDEFFVRGADLTSDLGAFRAVLERLQAGGGGDYPEALNEALHTAVHRISWRGEGTARLVVLVADAPPHLDYPGPQYDQDLRAAQARGIKLFSVGASGLNPQGEYIFRQMAQFTGGRFVFLTYEQANRPASGPGRETVHDVRNYSVETLDKLLVRLVGEEMARWPQAAP
ncbi:MAG: VWA domain-containing protein [Rubrivivax sp.]|nr:VWA domain-containing protein [Rubrivivax sp.]